MRSPIRRRSRDPNPWRRLLPLLRFARLQAAGACLLIALEVTLGAISPLLLRRILDRALPYHQTGSLVMLSAGLGVCAIGTQVGGIWQGVLVTDLTQRLVHRLRMSAYDAVEEQPLPWFTDETAGELNQRLGSGLTAAGGTAALTVQSTLSACTQLAAAVIVMFFLSPLYASISIAAALGLGVFSRHVGRQARQLAVVGQTYAGRLASIVSEDFSFDGVLHGRTFQRVCWQRGRFEHISSSMADVGRRQRRAGLLPKVLVGAGFGLITPSLFVLAGTVATGLSVGTVVVLLTLQTRLAGPMQQLFTVGTSLETSRALLARVLEYTDLPLTARTAGPPEPTPAAPVPPDTPDTLVADGLNFSYPRQTVGAVRDLDLTVRPNDLTLIVGPSGSGKSTIALLLAGLLEPTSGRLGKGDTPGNPLSRNSTLVPQEPWLFNGTVRDNLKFGREEATDPEIWTVLARVGLAERIASCPGGLDWNVGEQGRGLSGGERQRLSLGRALLDDASLLVVDEATSGADSITARTILTVLEQESRRRTVVLVAHRLSGVAPGTRVAVIDRGRCIQTGSHADLAAKAGPYKALLMTHADNGGGAPCRPRDTIPDIDRELSDGDGRCSNDSTPRSGANLATSSPRSGSHGSP